MLALAEAQLAPRACRVVRPAILRHVAVVVARQLKAHREPEPHGDAQNVGLGHFEPVVAQEALLPVPFHEDDPAGQTSEGLTQGAHLCGECRGQGQVAHAQRSKH